MNRESSLGQIITFYSYKGGTGRSMALANVACLLAQQQKADGVLMIDWDLEAPGLHRYFQNNVSESDIFKSQLGLIDLFYAVWDLCQEAKYDDDDIPEDIFESINAEKYFIKTTIRSLDMMSAGK